MTPSFLSFVHALNPNPRFWLLQSLFVPLLALLGSLYITSSVSANEPPVTEAPAILDDYVLQAPSTEHPIAQPAVDASPYQIYFSHYEFPTRFFGGSPSDPTKRTQFQLALHQAVNHYPNMKMTDHLEKANYRVEIECAGLLLCSRVQLNVYDLHRNFLAAMQMPRAHLLTNEYNLRDEARQIAEVVNRRLLAFPQGGYGNYLREPKVSF